MTELLNWLSYPLITLLPDWVIQLTKLSLGYVTLFTEPMVRYLLATLALDCLHHIWTSIASRKAIASKFQRKALTSVPRSPEPAPRRHSAATAPHTASHTSHASLLSNLHIVPRLPRKLQPLDWAHLMTEQLTELPLDYSIPLDWASQVSYLLVTLPHDGAIQWWVTSWFITLPPDWASQLWATSWLLYYLTELVNCELPLGYSTTWLNYLSTDLSPIVRNYGSF